MPGSALLLLARLAATPEPWLHWQAPSPCAQAGSIARRVDELLGASPATSGLRVSGRIRRDGAGWQLRLVARRDGGVQQRRLRHADCTRLGEAAALLIALAVDPAAVQIDPMLASLLRGDRRKPAAPILPVTREPAPWVAFVVESLLPAPARRSRSANTAPASPPRPAAGASSTSAPPTAASARRLAAVLTPVAPPARRLRTVALRIGGGLGLGATPGVGGAVVGALAVTLGRFARVEVPLHYLTPTRARLPDVPTAGAAVSLAAAGLRGCGVPGRGIVEVPLCLGGELGSMRATGFGVDEARSPRSLWAALSPGVAMLVALRPWLAVGLGLDVALVLTRPRFVVDGRGDLWQAGRVGLRAWLSVEVRAPAIFRRRR